MNLTLLSNQFYARDSNKASYTLKDLEKLLCTSRPTLTKLLAEYEVPVKLVGGYRKVLVSHAALTGLLSALRHDPDLPFSGTATNFLRSFIMDKTAAGFFAYLATFASRQHLASNPAKWLWWCQKLAEQQKIENFQPELKIYDVFLALFSRWLTQKYASKVSS